VFRIAVLTGSTRQNRNSPAVASWVIDVAREIDAPAELVDLADQGLPLLDEPVPAALSDAYVHESTQRWGDLVSSYDAFVFVTPEYNHSLPGALKNALDLVYREWNDKVAGIVSYGLNGGVRAAEHLRLVCAELQVATVRTQVALSLFDDFDGMRDFAPKEHHRSILVRLLDEVWIWGHALQQVRLDRPHPAAGGGEQIVVVGAAPWKLRDALAVLDQAGFKPAGAVDRSEAIAAIETSDRLLALVLGGAVTSELEQELIAIAAPKGAAILHTAIGEADPTEHYTQHVLPQLEELRHQRGAKPE